MARSKRAKAASNVTALLDSHFKTGKMEDLLVAKDLWLESGGSLRDWPMRYLRRTRFHSLNKLERFGSVWRIKRTRDQVIGTIVNGTKDDIAEHIRTFYDEVKPQHVFNYPSLLIGFHVLSWPGNEFIGAIFESTESNYNRYFLKATPLGPSSPKPFGTFFDVITERHITTRLMFGPHTHIHAPKYEHFRRWYDILTGDHIPVEWRPT